MRRAGETQQSSRPEWPTGDAKREALWEAAYALGRQLRPILQAVKKQTEKPGLTGLRYDRALLDAMKQHVGPELKVVGAGERRVHGKLFIEKPQNVTTLDGKNSFTAYVDTDRAGAAIFRIAVDPNNGKVYVGVWAMHDKNQLHLFGPLEPKKAARMDTRLTTGLESYLQGPIADGVWGERMRPVT